MHKSKQTRGDFFHLHQSYQNNHEQRMFFTGLTNASLISIGRLCDDGCVAVFEKRDLRVFKQYKLVLKGKMNFTYGLWGITFDPTLQQDNKEKSPP